MSEHNDNGTLTCPPMRSGRRALTLSLEKGEGNSKVVSSPRNADAVGERMKVRGQP